MFNCIVSFKSFICGLLVDVNIGENGSNVLFILVVILCGILCVVGVNIGVAGSSVSFIGVLCAVVGWCKNISTMNMQYA